MAAPLPQVPDWLVYAGAVCGLLALAIAAADRADAPPAPPPLPGAEAALAAQGASLDPARARSAPRLEQTAGTAFSVSDSGVWLTARHVVRGCTRTAVLVSPGRGVEARAVPDPSSDLAVLITVGGAPALPLASSLKGRSGQVGFLPGYPRGQPGEAATRLLGVYSLPGPERRGRRQRVLAWAETGRTRGLHGSLAGLSGAPVLDSSGEVVGVALAEAPRRGRIYAASPEAIRAALAHAGAASPPAPPGAPVTTENYGRFADGLRRELSVAQVACLG